MGAIIRVGIMQGRTLGSTGLRITPIGLGLAALGRPEYINLGRDADLGADRPVGAMEARCHQILDVAYAAGVRYVDAARSYGLAEQFLASWLRTRQIPPAAVTVGSKWGYTYTADWRRGAAVHEVKDLSADTLERQFAESAGLLGDRLQLYQIHSATLESGALDDRRVLESLARLRANGLAIGLTTSGPRQAETIRRALDVSVDGVNPFQVIQATWNLLETSAGPALAEARARGWGVIVKESLANGRLTERHASDQVEPARREAAARGITLDACAIAAALAQPWADVVLSGAATPEQLHSNLAALDVKGDMGRLPSIAMSPREYWAARGTLAWR
jgi:aryl-alcohol dehydrogenase-like predicted oxidoreductase